MKRTLIHRGKPLPNRVNVSCQLSFIIRFSIPYSVSLLPSVTQREREGSNTFNIRVIVPYYIKYGEERFIVFFFFTMHGQKTAGCRDGVVWGTAAAVTRHG